MTNSMVPSSLLVREHFYLIAVCVSLALFFAVRHLFGIAEALAVFLFALVCLLAGVLQLMFIMVDRTGR